MESGFETYRRGFEDGQEVLLEQILSYFAEEDPHPTDCECRRCLAVRTIWGQAMVTIRLMIGPEEWHRLGNNLAVEARFPSRPPFSE